MKFFFYCDNPDCTNTHTIHTDSCSSLPEVSDRSLVGKASSFIWVVLSCFKIFLLLETKTENGCSIH